MCIGKICYKSKDAPPAKKGEVIIITMDNNLVEYAERRAKEILKDNMAYSPPKKDIPLA